MNFTKPFRSMRKAAFLLLICTLVVFALAFPKEASKGILRGLSLCYRSVIPALFPFFIVTQLVMGSFVKKIIGKAFCPYLRRIGIREKSAGSALLLGILGGFAVGASSIASLYRQNELSSAEASLLLCAAVNAGPAFIVSAVGYSMLGNQKAGILLLAALLLASAVTGFIMHFFIKPARRQVAEEAQFAECAFSFSPLFVQAIGSAVTSTLSVCGYVLFFSFLYGVLAALVPSGVWAFLTAALLEVTGACAAALQTGAPLYAAAGALSVLGCSVFMQVRALIPEEISLKPLLFSRFLHLPLTLLFTKALTMLFPMAAVTGVIDVNRLLTTHRLPPDAGVIAFLFCLLFVCELSPKTLFEKKGTYKCTEISKEKPPV